MRKELPLRIFIRNSVVLSLLFFVVSGVIIEKRRQQNGEKSLFNNTIIKQDNTMDKNEYDIINSYNTDPINTSTDDLVRDDSLIALSYFPLSETLFNKYNNHIILFSK